MKPLAFALLMAASVECVASAQVAPPREGDYGGVAPGRAARERNKNAKRGPGYLTWVGFEKLGDAPRVFVRVTTAVTPEQQVAGDQLVVRFPGLKLDTFNNSRPLDTRWFGTNVTRVKAVEVKGVGVELHVSFTKGSSEAKISTAPPPPEDPDGGSYLYLDF